MDIPNKISGEHLPMLWSYAREYGALVNKNKRRKRLCAIMGHIAFHVGLACLGLLFSYAIACWSVTMEEGMAFRDWYYELTESIKLFLESIAGNDGKIILVMFIAFAAIVLLLVPFVITLIIRICSCLIKGTGYLSRPSSIRSTKQEAEMLLKEIERINQNDSHNAWDDYYPMNEIGDLVEINAFNFIPCLTFALSVFFGVLVGVEMPTMQYVGCLLLVLIISFISLLVIVPLWKLSSIINANLYKGCSKSRNNSVKVISRLKEFIDDCEKAEEQKRLARIAKEREEEERKQAEKMKTAAELYAQAIQGEEINMELLIQAADMGNPSACKEYGKILYLETNSGLLTRDEREGQCKIAAKYLEKAKNNDIESELLWLACRITYESNDIDEWKAMLNRIRAIKASGKIPEAFNDVMNTMIQILVQTIDGMAVKQVTQKPKRGRFYCRFYNAGICNYQSNEYFVYKCTDPVNQSCNFALLNNGIAYEEY